jgi:hypothetical protein
LQIFVANLRAFKSDRTKAIAFAAVVVDIPEGLMTVERNAKLAFNEFAVKVALTQRNARERALEAVIIAMIEDGADSRAVFNKSR